jgi:hypothetical protein
MPMRITDNAKCNVTNPAPYCYGSALTRRWRPTGSRRRPDGIDSADPDGLRPEGHVREHRHEITTVGQIRRELTPTLCVTEDGLPLLGNTAATRPGWVLRLRLDRQGQGMRSSTAPSRSCRSSRRTRASAGAYLDDEYGFADLTQPCTVDRNDPDYDALRPLRRRARTSVVPLLQHVVDRRPMVARTADGLLDNLGFHGNMLNQPEVNWTTGEFFGARHRMNTELLFGTGTAPYNYDIYNTEIARRGSLAGPGHLQGPQGHVEANGLLALPTWKQGQMNQGGPGRRHVAPDRSPNRDLQQEVASRTVKGWDLERTATPTPSATWSARSGRTTTGRTPTTRRRPLPGLGHQPVGRGPGHLPGFGDRCIDRMPAAGRSAKAPAFGIGNTKPILQGRFNVDGQQDQGSVLAPVPGQLHDRVLDEGTTLYCITT